MATNPQFPNEPERRNAGPRLVEEKARLVEEKEWAASRPFPWALVGAIVVILIAIALAWYFFH
jgi:hypothetical protein